MFLDLRHPLKCRILGMMPPKDDHPVRATWSRRFWGFHILAFADHTYQIDFGSDRKPPLITVGWWRWYPISLAFPRFRKLAR
jgi:hypothetical protein